MGLFRKNKHSELSKQIVVPKTRDEIILEKIKEPKLYSLFESGAELYIEQSGDFSAAAQVGVNVAKAGAALNKNTGYKFYFRTQPNK